MMISLHKNATTTPSIRKAIQQASGTDRELAKRFAVGIGTIRRLRHRDSVNDASHTPHHLKTRLNKGQEYLDDKAASSDHA